MANNFDLKYTFGTPNKIQKQTRTPLHLDYEGKKYYGLIIESDGCVPFILWNSNGVPSILMAMGPRLIEAYLKIWATEEDEASV